MNIHTIRTFANAINRSEPFVRRSVALGKIEAEKLGGRWLIPGVEVQRFKNHPFKISRTEMIRG